MLSKIDQDIAFNRASLDLRARRQEILSANLANADTPNYAAKDLDFAAALRDVMRNTRDGLPLARTAAAHLAGVQSRPGDGFVKYRAVTQPSLDGNTVDPDVERAHFAENALHYQFLLDRMGASFKTLAMAVAPNS